MLFKKQIIQLLTINDPLEPSPWQSAVVNELFEL